MIEEERKRLKKKIVHKERKKKNKINKNWK